MQIVIRGCRFDVPDSKHSIYNGLSWSDVISEYFLLGCKYTEIQELIKKDIELFREINLEILLSEC